MRIERHTDAAAYERLVSPLLLTDEPRFNLELSLVHRLASGETFGDEPPVLLTLGDGPDGVALMTPPHNLLVAAVPPDAATDLADWVVARALAVPGVMGAPGTVDAFAGRYAAATGSRPRLNRGSGVYRLTTVIPPRPASGAMRVATFDDADLLWAWLDAFMGDTNAVRASREADEQRLRDGRYWLWDDGGPVSLCGCSGTTPNGARVGPVYTPPEHRGRGYASALTAAVTQVLLDEGRANTFLYTDLANPTSNKIYRAIGYEHVADVHEVVFDR